MDGWSAPFNTQGGHFILIILFFMGFTVILNFQFFNLKYR
jgi:hypothetical protein